MMMILIPIVEEEVGAIVKEEEGHMIQEWVVTKTVKVVVIIPVVDSAGVARDQIVITDQVIIMEAAMKDLEEPVAMDVLWGTVDVLIGATLIADDMDVKILEKVQPTGEIPEVAEVAITINCR